MANVLSIGGRPLSNFDTYYDGSQWFNLPNKEVENISVPGRNGDLTIQGNRFENISIPFNCYIPKNFRTNYSSLMNYLFSLTGYQRVESNEETDVYRMGQIKASVTPNMGQYGRYGSFPITIDFQPQKWLKTGETGVTIASAGTVLTNPTLFNSKPLLKVQGTGTIRVNSDTIVLGTNTGETYIDCEMQDAYEGTINRNSDITLSSGAFPVLVPGTNNIDYLGNITSLVVVPRWWRL